MIVFVGRLKQILYWVDVTFFLLSAAALWMYGRRGVRFYSGMALAGVSFVFWMTARFQLGRSFSVTAKAKRLVTGGLYSKIRNPIYLFGGLGFAGLALAWGNPIGLLWFLQVPFQAARAYREQMVLERAFGDEYRSYKARTWF